MNPWDIKRDVVRSLEQEDRRLRDAAPELLAACRLVLQYIENLDAMKGTLEEALQKAVAKAEGKE